MTKQDFMEKYFLTNVAITDELMSSIFPQNSAFLMDMLWFFIVVKYTNKICHFNHL